MGIRDAALENQKRVHEQLYSEQAALGRVRQELQAAYQDGRVLFTKAEKQDQQLQQLKTDNRFENSG